MDIMESQMKHERVIKQAIDAANVPVELKLLKDCDENMIDILAQWLFDV